MMLEATTEWWPTRHQQGNTQDLNPGSATGDHTIYPSLYLISQLGAYPYPDFFIKKNYL